MNLRILKDVSVAALAIFLGGIALSYFLPPYYQSIAALCGINVVLAVSLNMVNGFTGQFSMGHAGFMAVGAYISATFSALLLPLFGLSLVSPWIQNIAFGISILIGGLFAALAGLCVGIPSLRLRGDYLAIVTLGFGEIIRTCILNIDAVGGARGMIGIPQWSNLYWIFGGVLVSVAVLKRVVDSIPGKQYMAIRDDEIASTAMGLMTTRVKVQSFVLASFFAGVAGALFAHHYAYLNPSSFNFNYSFQIITMVVLGGMGSLSGSITAALLLTIMLEALRPLQDLTRIDLRMVIYALILIVLMLTRPQGLFGQREIWNWRRRAC